MSIQKQLIKQRTFLEDLAKRRFIFTQSYEIYGGVSGFYDFGPIGCTLKNNLIQLWRKEFIQEEELLEVGCSNITPEIVFKNSGHIAKFSDLMVVDIKTKEPFRADKLIEEVLEKRLKDKKTKEEDKKVYNKILNELVGYNIKDIDRVIKEHKIKSIVTNNELSEAYPFNLMFETSIGPLGNHKAYLKPETAQGIFLNFKRLLEFNLNKLPFGSAQVGLGFRNEISPRNSLLRVREFDMGEIEYFFDPEDNNFSKFDLIKDIKLMIYSKENQVKGEEPYLISINEIFNKKIITNKILCFYLAKSYNFLLKIGINKECIRFREHLETEMAHYSKECWDAEILTSYGWIECVGHANRSAYDLECHTKGSGDNLIASRKLDQPIVKQDIIINLKKSIMGKNFKKDSQIIFKKIESMNFDEKKNLMEKINSEGSYKLLIDEKEFILNKECFEKIKEETVKIHEQKFTPHVIEPSFGFGRILYSILEHSFKMRDEKRTYLNFSPLVAPIKVVVLPLLNKDVILNKSNELFKLIKKNDISVKTDTTSQTIGKRYARTEEIGIPFGITVDFQTLEDNTVTLRESVSMDQLRIPVDKIISILNELCSLITNFEELKKIYPKFEQKEE